MHLADICGGRRQPSADGPDRLIGDHDIRRVIRQGAIELRADHGERRAGLAFGARLPDANDREQAGALRRQRLGAHGGIGLAVIAPAFGMTDDDRGGPGILEHFRRNIPGISARGHGVAILAPDRHGRSARGFRKARDQRCRRTHDQVDLGQAWRAGDDLSQVGDRAVEAIHFPIAGDQRTARHHRCPNFCLKPATNSR